MEKEYLEIIKDQQETIKTLALELAGLTNAFGQLLVQNLNRPEIDRTKEIDRLEKELNTPDESTAGSLM